MHTPLAKHLFAKPLMESNFPGIRPVSAAFKSSKQVLYNLLVGDGVAATPLEAKAHVEHNMTDADVHACFHSKSTKEITDVYSNAYWAAATGATSTATTSGSGIPGISPCAGDPGSRKRNDTWFWTPIGNTSTCT